VNFVIILSLALPPPEQDMVPPPPPGTHGNSTMTLGEEVRGMWLDLTCLI
jgi:hypothetical protein